MPTEPRQQWPHRREPGGQALAERDAGDRVVAILAAASLFLASIELAIPKPVPFLRLGLANLPILIALRVLRPRQLLLLLGLKILGQGMVQGTLFSYIILFSAASSVRSVITIASSGHPSTHIPQKMHRSMSISNRLGYFSLSAQGASLASMVMHSAGQAVAHISHATHLGRPCSSFVSLCSPRYPSGFSHFSSGYCIVIFFPRRCLKVNDSPFVIAGRYIFSVSVIS